MMDAVKNLVKDLQCKRTLASDYPSAERIEKGLIPVYDANNVSGCASSTFRKLLLEELDINAAGTISSRSYRNIFGGCKPKKGQQ